MSSMSEYTPHQVTFLLNRVAHVVRCAETIVASKLAFLTNKYKSTSAMSIIMLFP